MDVIKSIKEASNIVGISVEQHSPEILMGLGIASMVGATVLACKGTMKAKKVLENAKEEHKMIETAKEIGKVIDEDTNEEIEYTENDYKKDKLISASTMIIGLAKAYGPAVILTATGIALIINGQHILRKRNLALIAAYESISDAYKRYREKVKETFGEDTEKSLRYGTHEEEIDVETGKTNKDGTPKTKKEKRPIFDGQNVNDFSPYARFYDSSCKGWENDPAYNLSRLLQIQNWCNQKLQIEHILTLNDVYDELGIPRTKQGQVVGWSLLNGKGDGYVDFGIYNEAYTPNRDFVNGYEPVVLLDFNVDGVILNDFPSGSDR